MPLLFLNRPFVFKKLCFISVNLRFRLLALFVKLPPKLRYLVRRWDFAARYQVLRFLGYSPLPYLFVFLRRIILSAGLVHYLLFVFA
ncbi:MAG: hypothetical protein LBC77_06965 [Spirochaetaceae bacterium]|jgi:hypothetical protein|nr:hypothetical protein [Spirochaetaceae bacterium]